jgi:hypothetical protein
MEILVGSGHCVLGPLTSCIISNVKPPQPPSSAMAIARTQPNRTATHVVPAASSDETRRRQLPTALPAGWETSWRSQDTAAATDLDTLRVRLEELASGIPTFDERRNLQDAVNSADLHSTPIHRWYTYKEGFSPRLPHILLGLMPARDHPLVIADTFAGVATTPLTLQFADNVASAIGVEYSPFAHFVGSTKLRWAELDCKRLRRHAARLARTRLSGASLPELTSFHDKRIFPPRVAETLASARQVIASDPKLHTLERDFFLLGLASTIEDVSGAAKDGRALRIMNGRSRSPKVLSPVKNAVTGDDVQTTLLNQWLAMIEDVAAMAPVKDLAMSEVSHYRGDARDLAQISSTQGNLFSNSSIDYFFYSPPYLNCIDYTEVYKLELWLLEFVRDQAAFRSLRLGTLRSHPSIEFPVNTYFSESSADVSQLIRDLALFIEQNHTRPNMGRMVQNYFEDMYQVFVEQARTLQPRGRIACVVANSTFSRRQKVDGKWREHWSLPVPSDIILARLAELAGLIHAQIWDARALRPRNVQQGAARESVVVAEKPDVE